jgi:threonine synthase
MPEQIPLPGATHLECTGTGAAVEGEQLIGLSAVGKPLFARYHLDAIGDRFTPDAVAGRDAATYAAGLRVPGAVGDFLILRVLRESGGGAVAVPDQVMAQWVLHLGADTGIFAAPEGGATAAAVPKLVEKDLISPDDEVVLFNTGGGLKYAGMESID